MHLHILGLTRRFVRRAAIFAVVAVSALVATAATAQAAQRNQAAYKLAISRYTQILKTKKSAVQAAETKAYNAIVPCWESWMETVVTESNNSTLPANADPYEAIDSMSGEVDAMIYLDAASPFQNPEDALIQAQLNRHQFNSVNAARAKRMLALIHKMYATNVCSDANNWLSAGLTDSEDPNFESVLEKDSTLLSSTAYNPQLMLPVGEVMKLDNLEDRLNNRQESLVKQVTSPVIAKLSTVAATYYNNLG